MKVVYILKRVNFPGQVIINPEQSNTCGRGKENEIVCPSMLVSRTHCIFIIRTDGLYIRDVHSSNGVYVNGEKKRTDTKLDQGDLIGIGIPELSPDKPNCYVYCLEIQGGDQKALVKKRPADIKENIPSKRLRAEESSSNITGRVVERTSDPLPIDVSNIKSEPDDDIEIVEIVSHGSIKHPAATEVSKPVKPEAGPSQVPIKSNERRFTELISKPNEKSEIVPTNINENHTEHKVIPRLTEKLSDMSNKSSAHTSDIFNKLSERQSKNATPIDKLINKECKIVITKIETLCKDNSFSFKSLTDVNRSLANKTEFNQRHNSSDPKITQCHNQPKVPEFSIKSNTKSNTTAESNSSSIIKNSNKENLQNGQLTNEHCSILDNIKIKEEPPDINTGSSKDTILESSSSRHLEKKVNVLESKSDGNVSRILPIDCKTQDYKRPMIKEPFTQINPSAIKTSYHSDDELFVVNEIMNPMGDDILNASSSTSEMKIKEEPITNYSQNDIVYLSSDEEEDNAYPCSQLFYTMDEESIVKKELTENGENDIQEPPEEDVIILSDSDDEDNPWLDKLFNSQVYRPVDDIRVKNNHEEQLNIEQSNTELDLGIEPLFPEAIKEESDLEISKKNEVPVTLEAKEKKITQVSKKIEHSQSDQELEEQPKKKIKKMDKKEDKFLDEKEDLEDESSSFKNVLKSIKAFEDSCARRTNLEKSLQEKKHERKSEDSRKTRKSIESEKERQKYFRERQRKSEDHEEKLRINLDDQKRRKSTMDNRERQRASNEDNESLDVSVDRKERRKTSEKDREGRRTFVDNLERRKTFNGKRESPEITVNRRERQRSSTDNRERRKCSEDRERSRASMDKKEKQKLSEKDSERRRYSFDNREKDKRNSYEIDERKNEEEGRERRKESERNRGRRKDCEDSRDRNKENEEKRARRKQEEEYQAKKRKKEDDGFEIKRKEQDTVKEKRCSEDDRKRENKAVGDISHKSQSSWEDAQRRKSSNDQMQTLKTAEEICKRFFEDGPTKYKNVAVELKKLDKEFGNITRQTNVTFSKPNEEIPQTSKSAEVVSKKMKSWESELQNIDEKTMAIKGKQIQRRTPVLIQPPYMPKGNKRGISVSVYRNNNNFAEASSSKDEEFQEEVSKTMQRKVLPSVNTSRQRSRSVNSRNQIVLPRIIKEQKKNNKEIRKEKLKLITIKKPSTEENTTVVNVPRKSTAVVKITHKSRQDSLFSEQQKAATLKPGIAHQRMNNIQPVAHCSKQVPELLKINCLPKEISSNMIEEKSHKAEAESICKERTTFTHKETEQMLNNLISLKFEQISSKENEIKFTNDRLFNEAAKPEITIEKNDINKMPRRSCLASFPFNGFKQKEKRRISFDLSKNTIRYYEIEVTNSLKRVEKKDAPIKRPKFHPESKIDEYLSRIFCWNPNWLEEQKNLPNEPPVYAGDNLISMQNYYHSFTHYCNILRPLLLLEIWNALTKESESEEKKYKFRMLYCSVVKNSITKTKLTESRNQTCFLLELLISAEDFKRDMYPGPGHLIVLEFQNDQVVKDSEGRTKRRTGFRTIFAYVQKKCHTLITPNTRFNYDLKKLTRDPEMLLTLTVLTKEGIEPPTDRTCKMRGAIYLKSNMREILALQNFDDSPLKSLILTPMIQDYVLPRVYLTERNPLVTKDTLNEKQIEAVMRISEATLSEKPQINLIHGPPGTGKSKVIVNIVAQILSKSSSTKILVCAPSNAAVDELVIRLLHFRAKEIPFKFKMVRVGRPEAMNPRVKSVSLAELVRKQVESDIAASKDKKLVKVNETEIKKLESLIDLIQQRIEDVKRNGVKGNIEQLIQQRLDLHSKCNLLKADIANHVDLTKLSPGEMSKLHRKTEERMLSNATVIACTLSSCYSGMMEKVFGRERGIKIPICIVDEATQSCETENLIPLMLGVTKLILVGDTNQLPATILSKKAKEMKLDQSLFARIQKTFENCDESPVIMLDTQYRMDYPILSWPNSYFYEGKLKGRAIIKEVPYGSYRVLNLNSLQDNSKFSNTIEAEFVSKIIYIMQTSVNLKLFEEPLRIGVITPYQNQRNVILSKIENRLGSVSSETKSKFVIEVNTVDSFQGQERDVIIMSCVRSNGIGFMSDRQRLCVALTRAKSSLILCGNFKTFERDEMWNELLTNAKTRGIYTDVPADADLNEIKTHILR